MPQSQGHPEAPFPEPGRAGTSTGAWLAGVLVLALVGVVAGVIAGFRLWSAGQGQRTPPSNDPRVHYSGEFQNIHPDVAYVGNDRCAECHQEQFVPFRKHPMGRTLLPIAALASKQLYDGEHHNPFDALGSRFEIDRRGDRVLHRRTVLDAAGQPLAQTDFDVDYVIGSGLHGFSYLSNRDGYLFQTPISWFSRKQIWDKSPGFDDKMIGGRPVVGDCMFCHANRSWPIAGSVNRYEPPIVEGLGIGCERCHGPGGKHVENPGRDPDTRIDYSIVNPRWLKPELRAAICEQCHLEGKMRIVRRGRGIYDFRPGMPLTPFWSVFVRARDAEGNRRAVNHVEQMYESRCFQRSEEKPAEGKKKLGCTSCHDPHRHEAPAERVAHYREACLACHQDRGCSVAEVERRRDNKDDSCIDCHMLHYASLDIPHNASTDHHIVRRPGASADPDDSGRWSHGPGLPVIPFYPDQRDPDDPDMNRAMGMALVTLLGNGEGDQDLLAPQAVAMLEKAVRNDPEDVDAWEAKGQALMLMKSPSAALATFETALSKAPDREASLAAAAVLCQDLNQLDPAIDYWRRAVKANPWSATYRQNLSVLLAHKEAWDDLHPQCQAWVRLAPADVAARKLWVTCLLREGRPEEAKSEFEKIERMKPPNLRELQDWFAGQTGTRK
jgi:predicted CXXCH cytochrome family protein